MIPATYGDYWRARGTLCFWVAEHFGYRVGAGLAWLAGRLGMTPNSLTVLSFVCAVAGICGAVWVGPGSLFSASWLGAGMFLAYWLDCADGVLARVGGRSSPFGSIFDKVVDMLVTLVIVVGVGVALLDQTPRILPSFVTGPLLVFSVLPKAGYSVLSWLKDSHHQLLDRTKASVRESASVQRRTVRLVGNIFDDVPWRLGVAVAWGTGWYWEFAFLYSTGLWIIFVAYAVTTARALDRSKAELVEVK